MKLKLDEKALNAYINKAINEELAELYRQEKLAATNGTDQQEQPAASNGQSQTDNLDIHQILNNRTEIARFQTWFNFPRENGGMGGKLVVDGLIGPKTTEAWNQWLAQRGL